MTNQFRILIAKNKRGFTVFEVLVVVGILAFLLGTFYSLFTIGFKNQFFMRDQNEAVEQVKKGMTIIVKQIREAADGDNGAYPIVFAQDYTFTLYSDIDVDLITEQVRYFLEDNILKKAVIEPTGFPLTYNPVDEVVTELAYYVVNQDVGEPLFRYYNGDYPGDTINNPLPTPVNLKDLRMVELNILVNINVEKAPDNVRLTSFVQIRNLKNNL